MFDREKLFQWRTNAGLSATRMGELVGVGADTIRDWERGKTQPREDNVAALLRVMESYSSSDGSDRKPARKKKAGEKPSCDSMGRECRGCYYWDNYLGTCDYLLVAGAKRPCPPGKKCTVRLEDTGEKRVAKRKKHKKAGKSPRVEEFCSVRETDTEISIISEIPVRRMYN